MTRLSGHDESEELDIDGLPNANHVREMASAVGAASTTNAVDFLESCGDKINSHFEGLGASVRITKGTMAKYWYWQADIRFPSIPNGNFLCGVSIKSATEITVPMPTEVCGVVIPWLCVKGGRKGEDAVCRILDDWPHSRSGGGLVTDSGTVAFSCIPVIALPAGSFDVDRDPLITEVIAAFARINAEQTVAIANSVAGPKPQDDS